MTAISLHVIVSNTTAIYINRKQKQQQQRSQTELMNFSESEHCEPKPFDCSVMFSLVCESNVGFSMSAFINTHT